MSQFVGEGRSIFRGVEQPNGLRDATREAQFVGPVHAVGPLHPGARFPADRPAVVLGALPGLTGLVPSSVGGLRFEDWRRTTNKYVLEKQNSNNNNNNNNNKN